MGWRLWIPVVRRIKAGGLAVLGVFGQDTSGRIQGPLDDDVHSKAVYLACAREHA